MENKNIKISIIIPVYNAGKYLEKCLESITKQSLKEIEIICVNDGSVDNSLEILKKFQEKDRRIKIIDKKNAGVSSARNEALKIARGKYCLNIDSDDWIEQNFFKEMFTKAEKDDLDLVISDIILDYGNNEIKIKKELEIDDNKIISGKEYRELFFNKKLSVEGYTCNKLIKTNIYKENNIFYNEKISFMEDYEVILRLAYYLKKIGKINGAYYHYIQRKSSASQTIKNIEKNFFSMIFVFNNLEKFYFNKDKNIILRIKRNKILLEQYFIFKYNGITEKIYDNFLLEVKKENFILNKKEGEKLKLILLFNIIKVFNSKSIIKIIKRFIFKTL